MEKFIISGGKPLSGTISVSGSKNAVLPLMAACLLTEETCILENVPQIRDVQRMTEIFEDLGVTVEHSANKLIITAKELIKPNPKPELVSKLRASILLLGGLLPRLKEVKLPYPGGDRIGRRPIDVHLQALAVLGVEISVDENIQITCKELIGGKVVLEESSVTATENILLASVLAKGVTIIKLAAMEPHVQQLGEFLNSMGAKISGIGSPTLRVEGVSKLHGASVNVIPDSEEAASLIILAAATKSSLIIENLNPDFLEDYFLKIKNMKVNFEVGSNFVKVMPPEGNYVATKIQCGLYPKLNSDYLPPMAVLATQSDGETLMYEWLYENRLGYVPELQKMGGNLEILDPHRLKITGPTKLYGQKITSYDLRMGITLVIAALVAEGKTEIEGIGHVDRGYEHLEGRLQKIGASIIRSN